MSSGLIGGLIGGIVGLLGGLIGTYFSIRNTSGPKEKSFMIRVSVIAWLAILLFLALLWFVPSPYKYLLWIAYGILLPWGIISINKRLPVIRAHESDA